jgi:hypothetical protein
MNMHTTVIIRAARPVPASKRSGSGRGLGPYMGAMSVMEVGQSFLFKPELGYKKTFSAASALARAGAKRFPGRKYVTRKETEIDAVSVWRSA